MFAEAQSIRSDLDVWTDCLCERFEELFGRCPEAFEMETVKALAFYCAEHRRFVRDAELNAALRSLSISASAEKSYRYSRFNEVSSYGGVRIINSVTFGEKCCMADLRTYTSSSVYELLFFQILKKLMGVAVRICLEEQVDIIALHGLDNVVSRSGLACKAADVADFCRQCVDQRIADGSNRHEKLRVIRWDLGRV